MYNLIASPWIQVRTHGRLVEWGIEDVLVHAHECTLALVHPAEEAAILRQVLMPVALCASGVPRTPEAWEERWQAGKLDADAIGIYIAHQPFGQVASLRSTSGETKPSSLILLSQATGNNVTLFTGRSEADPVRLTPAESARAIVTIQCWDTAAIKTGAVGDRQVRAGKTTGNQTGPLGQLGVVVPRGRTLFETMMLNTPWVPGGIAEGDDPWWHREAPTAEWSERHARGLLDLLTWQSRRIRLMPVVGDDGEITVRRVVLAAGDRLKLIDPDIEPHTVWRRSDKPKAGEPPYRPVRHRSGLLMWPGLPGLLAVSRAEGVADDQRLRTSRMLEQTSQLQVEEFLPSDLPLNILSVGVEYGNQSAVIENVNSDVTPLPVGALGADTHLRAVLLKIVEIADALRRALNFLDDDLRRAAGGEPVPWDKSQRPGDQVLAEFGPVVHRLLSGLQREPARADEALDAWKKAVRRIVLAAADTVFAAAPPETFLGHEANGRPVRLGTAEILFLSRIRDVVGVAGSGRNALLVTPEA